MIGGECNCGAVAFETDADLRDVFMCHCSICRRYSGANGVAVLIANNNAFRWLRGEDNIGHWKKPDADWEAWFCKTCGSALPGHNDSERMFIPAGLINHGGDDLKVAHHIFVGSKASWDEIGDKGLQHPDGFGSGS